LQVGVTEPDGVGTGPGRGPGGSGTTRGQQEEGDTEGEAVAKGANDCTVGRGTAPRQGGIGTGRGGGTGEVGGAPAAPGFSPRPLGEASARRRAMRMTVFYASPEQDADLLYGGGFRAPDPFLAWEIEGSFRAALSPLEIDRARRTSRFAEVLSLQSLGEESGAGRDPVGQVLWLARQAGATTLGLPEDFPGRMAFRLREEGDLPIEWLDRPVCSGRLRKTASEEKAIAEVNAVIAGAFARVRARLEAARVDGDWIRDEEGEILTSEELRRTIGRHCLDQGCTAEGTIVAAGDQACDPHERGHGPLPAHELIIIDIFPRSDSTAYYGDLTRTFLKGRARPEQRRMVEAVRRAQEIALAETRAGITGEAVHGAVVRSFERDGWETGTSPQGSYGFLHGTGHGLGLELHEEPRVSPRGGELGEGMVVTLEPGLYVRGIGGCRIEDVVSVRAEGVKKLSEVSREWEIP